MAVLDTFSSSPLSSLDPDATARWAAARGLPAFRGRQLYAAVARRAVHSFDELTEFPQALREMMETERPLRSLSVRAHLRSRRDGSEKVLFALADGATVETVLIPSAGKDEARRRFTVCVSSQVGCPAACTFCATGLGGFTRNLTAYEIVDQVMYFAHQLRRAEGQVSNVVFMGMGEPFLNTPAVRQAVHSLTDSEGFGMGARRITISTVGIVPQIRKFASWAGQVNLAVSLHAPNDDLRSRLVPYNARFPIRDVLQATREYVERTRRRVTFEYVLLKGSNDALHLARELATILAPFGGNAHVNLIPWNPFREGRFVRSEGPDAAAFASELDSHGINATVRYSKGLDISAACGQLREAHESIA